MVATPPPLPGTVFASEPGRPATAGIRAIGYIIDALPTLVIGLFNLIPVAGPMIFGLLMIVYWLLRDIGGASLGKLVLGLEVRDKLGNPSTIPARIVRNIPLILGWSLFLIPLIGLLIGGPLHLVVIIVEIVVLFTQGERIGDKLAGTSVVRK